VLRVLWEDVGGTPTSAERGEGKEPKKFIYVKGKMINVVV
jgi:hypothetical protein